MTFDLLVRGGMVIDGSGAPRCLADVGLVGDRIAAVGLGLDRPARHTIDATGHVIAPGFIDTHTHDDSAACDGALMAPKLLQGVTTVVTGNCGISAAPWSRDGRPPPPLDLLDRSRLPTAGFAAYAQALRAAPPQTNVLMLLGMTTVRAQVMGDTQRPATVDEVRQMQAHVEEAMAAGAAGVSIGTYYPPAQAADADEIVRACAPLRGRQALLSVHLRDEGDRVLQALDEAMDIARRLEVTLVISHHKLVGSHNHGRSAQTLRRIEDYARLAPVCVDCYPYTASSTMLDPDKADRATRVQVAWSEAQPDAAGCDLDELAQRWSCSRREAARRLVPGGAIYFAMNVEDVRAILTHPLTMVGSDGLPHDAAPHPRLWGAFARVVGPLVRDEGWLTLESAVHKMTGLPAQRLGLPDRGRVASGARADLVVFDPAQISDRATYDAPCLPPTGIACVIINGRVRVRGGRLVDGANGRVLAAALPSQTPGSALA
jgi:N-acyl-D-amino-acid deacylase